MNDFDLSSDRFEIIAIVRGALKNQDNVSIKIASMMIPAVISKIDNCGFHIKIPANKIIPDNETYAYLSICNDNAKYEFQSSVVKKLVTHDGYYLVFSLPVIIRIYQRRRQTRLNIWPLNFTGNTTHNGYHYTFRIQNISQGGCSLIIVPPVAVNGLMSFTLGTLLRRVDLHFGDIGSISCHVRIVNQAENSDNGVTTLHGHFEKLDDTALKQLDLILTKIIIQLKRRHPTR